MMNNLVRDKLKEIFNLQDIIKTDELQYKSNRSKVYNFNEFSLPINEGHLPLNYADDEQGNFGAKLKKLGKGKKN